MQKRIFYVINIDKSRIGIILITAITVVLLSFAIGYQSANGKKPKSKLGQVVLNDTQKNSYDWQDLEKKLSNQKKDIGHSIYERNTQNNLTEFDSKSNSSYSSRDSIERKKRVKPKVVASKSQKKIKKYRTTPTKVKKITKRKVAKKRTPKLAKVKITRKKTALLKPKKEHLKLANTGSITPNIAYFSLQTGSFKSKNAAHRMTEGLVKQGFRAKTLRGNGNWVVRVGREKNTKNLWAIDHKLRKKKYSPIRVKSR